MHNLAAKPRPEPFRTASATVQLKYSSGGTVGICPESLGNLSHSQLAPTSGRVDPYISFYLFMMIRRICDSLFCFVLLNSRVSALWRFTIFSLMKWLHRKSNSQASAQMNGARSRRNLCLIGFFFAL